VVRCDLRGTRAGACRQQAVEVILQPRLTKRRTFARALAFIAIAITSASAAEATGLLDFRDAHDPTFPNQITCTQSATICTSGRSSGGLVFKLFTVGELPKNGQLVGAGVDTGDGRRVTPLICTHFSNEIRCGAQPAGGEKQFGLYLPG
jgi:hypothetical protein